MDSKYNVTLPLKKEWYGLFSHTGEELRNLALAAVDQGWDVRLQSAITDNLDYDGPLCTSGVLVHKLASRTDVDWLLRYLQFIPDNGLVTLNGYMGILSAETLNNLKSRGCKVYNIHPAPIQLYPDLRGKDPQERLYEGIQKREYAYIGVVIHEVDEGIDTGKIVHWVVEMADHGMTKDELYARLHELGTQAWEDFFRERMYEYGENH